MRTLQTAAIETLKHPGFEKRFERANRSIYLKHKVKQAREILRAAGGIFGDRLALAFSGGKDSLVALHLAISVNPEIEVIFNNTTVEFPETISYVKSLAKEWDLNLHMTAPKVPFFQAVNSMGWATHENRWCCRPYKEEPALEHMRKEGILAEVTGTTRTESIYRRSLTPFRMPSKEPYIIRVNPIYDWNSQEVWKYIKENSLPVNPLYGMGYRRIGCWCCPLNGPSHYRRLEKTHLKLVEFLGNFNPAHPYFSMEDRPKLSKKYVWKIK
jgi:phosphoadenosine phosphosulfate reductase